MSVQFPLPGKFDQCVGPLHAIEYPPQGTAFQVSILNADHGRFVLKVAHTPAMIRALSREAHILMALQQYAPFVAKPLADAQMDGGHAFLFSYLEGEPLHLILQQASVQERHQLLAQYAQTLRRVHSWTPDLPYSVDWLTETLAWLSANILACPSEVLVANTNSQFDGSNARHLLEELKGLRARIKNDIVFGHYDYCLPNVLVQGRQVAGIIDWSGGGYIDRRFDLATALFSMQLFETLQDASYQSTFLQAYGYTEPSDTLYFFEALHALTCAFWK
jgi:aminoglycoside phosphotransferase